jgi:6-phosphogluconolactonase
VTDLGVDKIFIYHKDLTLASTVNIPSGHGPRHLAFHEDGTHIFCANELESTISLLNYKNGVMELVDTVSVLPEDFNGQSTVAAIRCVGNTVYVSNRGHDSISVLNFFRGKPHCEISLSR